MVMFDNDQEKKEKKNILMYQNYRKASVDQSSKTLKLQILIIMQDFFHTFVFSDVLEDLQLLCNKLSEIKYFKLLLIIFKLLHTMIGVKVLLMKSFYCGAAVLFKSLDVSIILKYRK